MKIAESAEFFLMKNGVWNVKTGLVNDKRNVKIMNEFDIGDVVVVKFDIAGMKKGELGIISEIYHQHHMYQVYFNPKYSESDGFYNMVPESLELFTI